MDGLIRGAVERVTGAPADDFDWSESLTTAEELARVLRPGRDGPGVDLLFVTDHVNETVRSLDPSLVELAVAEPRVALGAEIQTVLESPVGSGRYREAPEVLMYGRADRERSPGGWHYGLSADTLSDIQATCRPENAPRIELHRVLAYCRANEIAHAISHPLDGHDVELADVLAAVSACRFIEAVNGGYGGESTRRLLRYIEQHNRLRRIDPHAREPERTPSAESSPEALTAWLMSRLSSPSRDVVDGIVPWGGSDAHLGRYDRVCMLYRPPAGVARPGIPEMIRDMVHTPAHQLLDEEVFEIEGRGNGLSSVLGEVLRLIVINARRNADWFRGPRRLARLLTLAPSLAWAEIARGRRVHQALAIQLDAVLDDLESRPRAEGTARDAA